MNPKRYAVIALCLAMLAQPLSGCGGDGEKSGAEPGEATVKSVLLSDGWTEADATEQIVYLKNEHCYTLDAFSDSGHSISRAMYYCIYDPLLTFDEQGELCPWLAESYIMSDDYLLVTLRLRNDVWFTNGRKLTADDAVFTFERLRDDDSLSDSHTRAWRPYLGEIRKIDEFTFSIHFAQPMPDFFQEITSPELAMLCRSAYEELGRDAYFSAPPGTGAYTVTHWDPDNTVLELTLRTDEHGYWGYRHTGTGTNVKNITIACSQESQTRLSALRNREAAMISGVAIDEFSVLAAEGLTIKLLPPANMTFFAFNYRGVLGDKNLREAVSLAIDRQLLLDTFFNGSGEAAVWFCRRGDPGWEGYGPDSGLRYDPERAAELVAASDYQGETLKFIYNTSSSNITPECVTAIQAMLEEIGLILEVYTLDYPTFNEQCISGDYDLCYHTCLIKGSMYETETHFDGRDRLQTGCGNLELQELCLSLIGTAAPEDYKEIYNQIYRLKAEEFGPTLPLLFPGLADGLNPGLSGVLYHNGNIPDLHACRYEEG